MSKTLLHTLHDSIELQYQQQTLFRYIYEPKIDPRESPRPYFHPLKTLAGNEVTAFRPHDHFWHVGLSMTSAHLSGQNFWGGPTYVRDKGYVQLANNGRMQHRDWQSIFCDDIVRCVEHLQWITQSGETWIDEERQIIVSEIDPIAQYWSLDLHFQLLNVAQHPLEFGSPTTAGRPMAGYGGLFWRGPRSFIHGKVLGPEPAEGPEVMGQALPWLAFIGMHDGNGEQSTILFIDQPSNPRYPTKWFVRNDQYPGMSSAFMFDETYTVQPGEKLTLTYRIVLACGAWSRTEIADYLARQKPA
jgi:hypothetical protein